jgi:hypothetical protein
MKQSFLGGAGAIRAAPLLTVLVPARSWAQTAITSTTLSAALGQSDTRMLVASATGIAPSVSNAQGAVIDREYVGLRSNNGTTVEILRGANGTRATGHASGATVWIIYPRAAFAYVPSGSCTRTNLEFVPFIVSGGEGGQSHYGDLYDCLGSQWVQVNAPGAAVIGSTVASATTIAATGTYFKVSGTVNPVTTITVPAGWTAGMCLALEPTAIWTTTTAGNIALGTTAVVGKVLFECWNGTKWAPSY